MSRLEQYMESTTTAGVSTDEPGSVIGRFSVLKTMSGDDNLRVDLVKTVDNTYQVMVYVLKDGDWSASKTYNFTDKDAANNKYDQLVKGF